MERIMDRHIFLICTVGGAPEPIITSKKHWKPVRILFLPSKETRDSIDKIDKSIISTAVKEGIPILPGCYDITIVPDPQDFTACVEDFRKLTEDVQKWLTRGENYLVVVDFTGGTKCMTASLALHAQRWNCFFSYIGGAERTKNGVGIVVSGKEQIVHSHNPWDVLGYQAIEDAVVLFDQRAFAAAANGLKTIFARINSPQNKREISTFKLLAEAYDAWDRFHLKLALSRLSDVQKNFNDIQVLFGVQKAK